MGVGEVGGGEGGVEPLGSKRPLHVKRASTAPPPEGLVSPSQSQTALLARRLVPLVMQIALLQSLGVPPRHPSSEAHAQKVSDVYGRTPPRRNNTPCLPPPPPPPPPPPGPPLLSGARL